MARPKRYASSREYQRAYANTAARKASRRRYLETARGKKLALAQAKRWRENNRLKYLAGCKKHDLKRHYNLTVEEWNELFAEQGYACAACGSPTSGRNNGQWCTDHNHVTGQVRGILCNGCNMAAGHLKDDPKRCLLLAKYLERAR